MSNEQKQKEWAEVLSSVLLEMDEQQLIEVLGREEYNHLARVGQKMCKMVDWMNVVIRNAIKRYRKECGERSDNDFFDDCANCLQKTHIKHLVEGLCPVCHDDLDN
jgi:hypothetical protein